MLKIGLVDIKYKVNYNKIQELKWSPNLNFKNQS